MQARNVQYNAGALRNGDYNFVPGGIHRGKGCVLRGYLRNADDLEVCLVCEYLWELLLDLLPVGIISVFH